MRVILGAYVFLLVLALHPGTQDPAAPVKWLISDWTLAVLALLSVASSALGGPAPRFRSPGVVLVLVLLAWHGFAALLSPYAAHALAGTKPLATLALFCLVASQTCRRPDQAFQIFACMVLAVAVSSLYGMYQASGFPDPFPWSTTEVEEYRGLPSTYANPNFAAHALVIGIVLACGMLSRSPWFALPGLLMAAHLFLTNSRGGRVALAAALVLFLATLWARNRSRRPARAAALALALTLAVGAVAVLGAVAMNKYRHDAFLPLDSSLLLRYNGYYGASQMILDRPLTGFGPDVYARTNAAYWTDYEQQWFAETGKKNMRVHNEALEHAVDAGLPAAALYMALMLWAVLRSLVLAGHPSRPHRVFGITLAAAFLAFAVDGLFGFNMRVPVSAVMVFVLLGVLAGISREAPSPGRPLAVAGSVVLLAAALVNVWYSTQFFRAERAFQDAEAARYRAAYYQSRDQDEPARMELARAYAALDRGARLRPWDHRFPAFMAFLDVQRGAHADAIARLGYALDPACADVTALVRLARACVGQAMQTPGQRAQSLETAQRVLDRVETLCPPLPAHWELRATLEQIHAEDAAAHGRDARPHWARAADAWHQALLHGAKDRARLQRLMARAWLAAGDPQRAADALARAAESDPEAEETWMLFHQAVRATGDPAPLQNHLHTAWGRLRKREPVPHDALAAVAWHLAVLYREAGQPAEARRTLEGGLQSAPGALRLWGEYTLTFAPDERLDALCERLDQAETALREHAGASAPPGLQLAAGICARDAGEVLACAEALAARAIAQAKDDPPHVLARDLSWMGDLLIQAAARVALPPGDMGILLRDVGEVFLLAGRWEAAAEALEGAAARLPGESRALPLARCSEALAQLGRGAEALPMARTAMKHARAPLVRHMLARRLAEAGQMEEARFHYAALAGEISDEYPWREAFAREYAAIQE